ncbi:MAG TPA: hypothetical protein VIF39_01940, partial [Hyphomicrobium sp.]
TFIARHPRKDVLLDMPVRIIGNPGSGKTMLASLVEFRLIEKILRDQSTDGNRALVAALTECNLCEALQPKVAGVRLPMETEYRDFWELPYEPAVKTKLVFSLIQARAMLGLIRNLTASRKRALENIRFVPRESAEAQLEQIGGVDSRAILERAKEVERAIYSIGASLIPPDLSEIPPEARDPYQPFEAIRAIEIDWNGALVELRPLVVLDDVHTLHPDQFATLFRAMARREVAIARWMMMRMDALSPSKVFQSVGDDLPGLKIERDYIDIVMQDKSDRASDRRLFRKMAADMADRYFSLVDELRIRGYVKFRELLSTEAPTLPGGKLDELRRVLDRDQRNMGIAPKRRAAIERLVGSYLKGATAPRSRGSQEDLRLGMIRVLMHRYAVRIARETPLLAEVDDSEPRMALKADAGVAEAARSHLHEKYGRPFHYGLDDVCDASDENAELFLHFAGALVERMQTRALQGNDPALTPSQQQSALQQKAEEMIEAWSFPFSRQVRSLTVRMAEECRSASQQPNAHLGAGANAIGIPENEMQQLLRSDEEIVLVLKFAIAYGAIVAQRNYGQGSKTWCLLELSGPVCLRHGLTLKRGGFLERDVARLRAAIEAG